MRAYSILRPVGMGTYPKGYEVAHIENFDGLQMVDEIGRTAYGYIEFAEPVPEDELRRYELVTHKPVHPKFEAALKAVIRYFEKGDPDKALEIIDKAESRYGIDRDELYQAFERAIS